MSFFEKILFYFLIGLIAFIVWDRLNSNHQKTDPQIIKYLDSIQKSNEIFYKKIDSLQTVKTEQYNIYNQIKIKYDTVRTNIDTMPSLDATKLLLSISRQLTAKGIE
jgi:hypothetical protein